MSWLVLIVIMGLMLQLSVFPLVSQAGAVQTFYISPSGKDTSLGSLDQPFATIKRATKSIQPGDTLVLRGGTYREQIDLYGMNGSPSAWYTLKNYPGEAPILQGNNTLGIGLIFNNCSYWQIEGIKMTGYTGAGLYIKKDSHDFNLSRLTIWGLDGPQGSTAGTEGILGEGSKYVTVKNCEIYNIGLKYNLPKDHGIYIGYGADHWTFESNRIHDNSGAGLQMYGSPYGSRNSLVKDNVFYNNHQWGLVIGSNATGNTIESNQFFGNKDADIYLLQSSSANSFRDNYFGSNKANYNVAISDSESKSNSFNYNVYTKPINTIFYGGEESFDFAKWQAHSQEAQGSFLFNPQPLPQGKVYNSTRLAGENRFQTAESIANEVSSGSVANVIIASGNNFPDALSGSVLAQKLKAPILLGGPMLEDAPETLIYVKNHLQSGGTIYILGGPKAVTEAPYTALGYKVVRIFGEDRYDTNKAVNDQLNVATGTPVVIASGNGFADGLSISSVAAIKGYPIILTDAVELPVQSVKSLETIRPKTVYIIGGTGVISAQVADKIAGITGLAAAQIVRIWGNDRYDTSLNIAKQFALETDTVTFAAGSNFPDALAGGVLAAKLNAPIILLDSDGTRQKAYIDGGNFTNLYFFGGKSVIPDSLRWKLAY